MNGGLAAFIAGVAIIVATPHTAAQTSDQTPRDEFIVNAWSNPADCNRDVAKHVSFSALAAHAEGLMKACVAVDGYWAGRALFGSAWDAKSPLSNTSDRLRGKRIGLYAQWESIGDPPDKPKRMLFVGRVQQCETSWPDAIMVLGYCHYTDGPILLVSQAFPN